MTTNPRNHCTTDDPYEDPYALRPAASPEAFDAGPMSTRHTYVDSSGQLRATPPPSPPTAPGDAHG